MYKILIVLVMTILFSGCGGGGGSSDTSNKTAYLIDSAISGVEYTCGDISGVTGENGEFTYNNNCKVTFKLGGIVLGNIDGSSINDDNSVLPADLLGLDRENTSDTKIINLIQFLQSIDDDNNPDNNIVITDKTIQAFKDCTLDFRKESDHLEEIKEVIVLINKELVTKENALKHYEGILSKRFGIDIEKKKLTIENEASNIDIKNVVVVNEEIIEKKAVLLDKRIQEDENLIVVEKVLIKEIVIVNKKEELDVIEEEIIIKEVVQEKEEIIVNNDVIVEKMIIKEVVIIDEKEKELVEKVVIIEDEILEDEEKGFSYNNQRDVQINIQGIASQIDKQVLLYENLKIVSTPVGDLETFENLIISTIFDNDGNFKVKQTLGNHIQSIWLVIPYYRIQIEVPIVNNNIYFKIDKQGYSL